MKNIWWEYLTDKELREDLPLSVKVKEIRRSQFNDRNLVFYESFDLLGGSDER